MGRWITFSRAERVACCLRPILVWAVWSFAAIGVHARERTFVEQEMDRGTLLAAYACFAPTARVPAIIGDYRYAVLRRAELAAVTSSVRSQLNRTYGVGVNNATGATGWDKRFDCTAFALAFQLELRARLMREFWHSAQEVTRPATFLVAYRVARSGGKGHCLLFLLTDKGPMFWDPMLGEVKLEPGELASIYYLLI